jgi:hypothetical protein
VPALLLLGACSGSDSKLITEFDGGNASGPIEIITVSGVMIDLTGTWNTACRTDMDSGTDTDEEIVFDGNTATYNNYLYPSSDASCTGTQSVDYGFVATVVADTSNSAITEWRNGAGDTVPAPMAADNSGVLSDTESFTNLEFTLTAENNLPGAGVGDAVNQVYVVDDTDAPTTILYRGDYDDQASKTTPYGGLADPFFKE